MAGHSTDFGKSAKLYQGIPLRTPALGHPCHRRLPYGSKDTQSIPIAQEGKPGSYRHYPLASRTGSLVTLSLLASKLNPWVATPGVVCTLHRLGAKLIPHFLMVPMTGLIRRL